jgi:hypothetical protein
MECVEFGSSSITKTTDKEDSGVGSLNYLENSGDG